MRTMAGGAVIHRITEACERMGYTMSTFELNAADYGVPQFRRRLFIVGIGGNALHPPERYARHARVPPCHRQTGDSRPPRFAVWGWYRSPSLP